MTKRTLDALRKAHPAFDAGFREGEYAREGASLIRSFREARKWTQKQLADALGVTQARVSAAENATGRDGPSFAFIKRTAVACGQEWPVQEKSKYKLKDKIWAEDDLRPLDVVAVAPMRPPPSRIAAEVRLVEQMVERRGASDLLDEFEVYFAHLHWNHDHAEGRPSDYLALRDLLHSDEFAVSDERRIDSLRGLVLQLIFLLGELRTGGGRRAIQSSIYEFMRKLHSVDR